MLSDGLTKYIAVNDLMISVMRDGRCSLVEDGMIPARQAAAREALREKQKAKKRVGKNAEVTDCRRFELCRANLVHDLRAMAYL